MRTGDFPRLRVNGLGSGRHRERIPPLISLEPFPRCPFQSGRGSVSGSLDSERKSRGQLEGRDERDQRKGI